MKHLQKISISNIRRFCENVEIEIGTGATIFLAPNGLGKTAIFEAIELALTGRVKRLLFPPEPLIKDNCQKSSIRLDFDEGEYCEAQFNKGTHPTITGDHKSLFGTVESQDLPFLLQLTHFLNQRGENWFVQTDGEEAGSQLDHLSIGREAAEVNKKIPSAKKAARSLFEQAQKKFDEADEKLKRWLELLEKRTALNPNITTGLSSRSILLDRINQIVAQIRDTKPGTNENLLSLKVQLGEVMAMALSITENFKKRSILLDGLAVVILDYVTSQQNFSATKTSHQSLLTQKLQIDESINNYKREIDLGLNQILQKETEIRKQQEIKFELDNLNRINREITVINESLPNLQTTINNSNIEYELAKVELENANKSIADHENVDSKSELSNRELENINRYKTALAQWNTNEDQLFNSLNVLLPPILFNYDEQNKQFRQLKNQELEFNRILNESLESFNSLNSASDNIKAALGVIISGYPSNRGDCPVCGEEYTPGELHRRMEAALTLIDPNLKAASEKLEIARNNIAKLKLDLNQSQFNINNAKRDLDWINEQITAFQKLEITFAASFPNCTTSNEATSFIAKLENDYSLARSIIESERATLPKRPSSQQMIDFASRVNLANTNLLNSIERLSQANEKVIELVERKSALENLINSLGKITGINELLLSLETELNRAKNAVETTRKALNNQQLDLDTINDEITRHEITISQISTRISGLRAQWTQARLSGEPHQQTLTEGKNAVETNIKKWEQNISDLENVNSELARWQVLEDNEKIEQEINTLKGEIEETEFTNVLAKAVEDNKTMLETITSKIQALNSFSSHLESELLTVHERIRTINPLWKKLLKRIVIDPRFAETTLDNYNYYKKQHAKVIVPVNGTNTLVSQVASEAQLTDIQLTFLLAMAEKYQWSPWKALLLDDPTQHHDLVHASAVFDLLRDYITEYNFQILMATHDTVQARFLFRKLQNDGIPVKLYTLYAGEGGVNVRLSSN